MKKGLKVWLMIVCLSLACLSVTAYASSGAAYSDEELCEMARQYYHDHNNGSPQYVEVSHEEQDTVVIHLYDWVGNHTATYDWYYVDRYTAKGTDLMGGRD